MGLAPALLSGPHSPLLACCWQMRAGGVLPNIHQVLLPTKKKSEKASGKQSLDF